MDQESRPTLPHWIDYHLNEMNKAVKDNKREIVVWAIIVFRVWIKENQTHPAHAYIIAQIARGMQVMQIP